MQKLKRKKKQKNRVEFIQKNITPGKHGRIGNLNFYSEEIAKEFIDKLISLSITKIFREKTESKISDFCFEGVIRVLNLALSISNINYDRDNIYDFENIIDDKKRLNTDENSYKIINHNKCNKARNKIAEKYMFEYTNINRDFEGEMNLKNKNIDDYLNKSVYYDNTINRKKKTKSNFWGNISQPNSYGPQRFAPKSNILNKKIIKKDNNKKKENQKFDTPKKNIYSKLKSLYSKKFSFSFSSFKESDSRIDRYSSKDVILKKERKYLILEMDKMKKLEEDKIKNEETEEIKELRKLKLEKIKFLEEEEDRLNKAKKNAIQKNSKLEYDIDTINLTSKEKTKNIQVQRKIIEEQIRKGNFTFDFNNNMILIRQIIPDNLKEDFPEVISKQKDKEKNKEKIKENLNLTEKENQSQTGINNNDKIRIKSLIEVKNNTTNYFNYKYGWKIEPSGSNFKLINPEVGVTIYEGNEIKTGGIQFFEKYNRFSIKDYSKILKEISYEQEIIKKKKKEEGNKKENEKMNSSVEISKIKKDLNPFSQKIKNIKLNVLKTKKRMNKSQSQIFTIDRASLYKNLLINEEKVINKKEIRKKNEKAFIHKIDPSNLFLKRMKNIMNKKNNKSLQMIDTFNKSIIKNINPNVKIDKDLKSLPIIPLKKNKSDIFSKKEQFFRTRTKKRRKRSPMRWICPWKESVRS